MEDPNAPGPLSRRQEVRNDIVREIINARSGAIVVDTDAAAIIALADPLANFIIDGISPPSISPPQ